MKAAPFAYHAPETLDELMALLPALGDARLLAGGQSLVPMLNMRYAAPDHVVDLNGIAALSGLRDDGAAVEIGAMTRQAALMASPGLARRWPILREALAQAKARLEAAGA